MISKAESDVIVVGGGPSGATASTLIAQKGYSVTLFERDHFPRYHIGESLIPETFWVLERLKVLDKLRGGHFIKKHSVQFINDRGSLSEPFYFWDNKQHDSSQTWQVLRSEFDLMMLNNAADQGVNVHEGVRVLEVLFEGSKAVGVKVQDEHGIQSEHRANVVVDAAGQSNLLMDRLGLRVWDPELKKAAVWSYWKGAMRGTGRDEGATLVMQLEEKKGWFWYIPLHDDIVSVGVVADFEYLFNDRGHRDIEKIYYEEIERCPGLVPKLTNAQRVEPVRAAKEYSYQAREVAGDGWVMVGDAFGFLDPLYSSGILLALKSGAMAADAICDGLAAGDVSAKRLGSWGPEYVKGMERMRRLICEFYDGMNFGKLVKRHPHLKGTITDMLIGDIFREEVDAIVGPINELRAERHSERSCQV
jgi:flavin-dependent dehydrogenase